MNALDVDIKKVVVFAHIVGVSKVKKELRMQVYNKYNNRCAYCGRLLEYKDMQVDHIRSKKHGGTDDLSNLNPSCRTCNHYKRALSLETYRKVWLGKLHERLEKDYRVKVALAYGIIKEVVPFDGKFYFERVQDGSIRG